MTKLTEADRAAFRRLSETGWVETPAQLSPTIVDGTAAARERYCRWATQAAHFYRGQKPVRFSGKHWKL